MLGFCSMSLSLTSEGIQSESARENLSSTFVFTLFTFCPPGPPDCVKLKVTRSLGTVILAVVLYYLYISACLRYSTISS